MIYNIENIGERIQRKRHSLNFTQEQLAEMVNTSKNTISEAKIRQVLNLLLIFAMYLVKILIIIF